MTTDDDIITRLVELHDHIQAPATAPQQDALRGQRLVRRRRTLSAAVAAAVVVLAVGIAQAVLPDGRRTLVPTPQPSPSLATSPSPTTSKSRATPPPTNGEWTPERIRAQGTPGESVPATASGLAWRQYTLCSASECGPFSSGEDMHVALEVSQDGRSALFEVRGGTHESFVRAFDESSVLVQDRIGLEPRRTRLVDATGGALELQVLGSAPAVPGPGVVVINTSPAYTGTDDVFLVDDHAGTLRPLDVPDEDIREWWPDVDEFLWGISYNDCRVHWATDGTMKSRTLGCQASTPYIGLYTGTYPPGWLRPGRMVVAETRFLGALVAVHVSLDRGATWQRIAATDEAAVAAILRRLG